MVYTYEFPNMTGGVDSLLVSLATTIPAFIPLMLLFVYLLVLLGGSISQKARTGFSDFPLWNLLGCVSALMISLAFSITVGIMNPVVLTVVITLTILSGVWLFLDTNRNEALV